MIQFDDHIFQMGWFNHQLDKDSKKRSHDSQRIIFGLPRSPIFEIRFIKASQTQ